MEDIDSSGSGVHKLLIDLKEGLDELRNKIQPLVEQVKNGELPTKDGISYLEAEGNAVSTHPVLGHLVEIRMFLEKIRPIDKKLHYQISKLLEQVNATGNDNTLKEQDDLQYKPNPEMLVPKIDKEDTGAAYKPPKMVPTSMGDEETGAERKARVRSEREGRRRASQSSFIRDLANDLDGKPEEVHEIVGTDSREFRRDKAMFEARAKQEEELMTRVPLSKDERKRLKHLKRSRSGLQGIMDDFNDDVGGLTAMEGGDSERRESNERTQRVKKKAKLGGKFKKSKKKGRR